MGQVYADVTLPFTPCHSPAIPLRLAQPPESDHDDLH